MIKIAVMGYGIIGSGVVQVIETNQDSICKKIGEGVEVKYILDLRDFEGSPVQDKVVHDYKIIAQDPEISIVVESMGGVEPAYTFVNAMLEAGKSVTTSNKALVAVHGSKLIAAAKAHNVNFMFEASVGGGIPIIRALNSCLTADRIEEINGIVNGTTNYMMTRMAEDGCSFEEALKDAQDKGFAEKDPTADIEGHDAGRKIAILTSLIAGQQVDFEDIYTEGISKITAADILYAKKMGRVIKLLAASRQTGDTYTVMVAPFLLSREHPLYTVNGVFNAVFVRGNMLGDAMFYGSGAGSLPTASAVVADVVELAKHIGKHIELVWEPEKLEIADYKKQPARFFVRTQADRAAAENVFGTVEYVEVPEISGETGFVTGLLTEEDFEQKAAALGIIQRIRFH
ncbi:MAG: homoserine dehydrogenase [Eubacterium sp.]|jgi:homoserine dehydrogenase|nr:homoserine dehydrogenase [Eubacterium sp.]